MAKKKAMVKKKSRAMSGPSANTAPMSNYQASANTAPMSNYQASAKMGPMSGDLIGAKMGKSQQLEVAQSQFEDKLRMKAKAMPAKAMPAKAMPAKAMPAKAMPAKAMPAKKDIMPPGTFKNAEGELVVGDMNKFRKSQVKKKKS